MIRRARVVVSEGTLTRELGQGILLLAIAIALLPIDIAVLEAARHPGASIEPVDRAAEPAGEAEPRLPPTVPRLRIWGEPTVREAIASPGSRSASSSTTRA